MPKVSVIIPVYNTEKYLKKCLDSVLGQTLSDIEVICINDCSTDGSLGILQDYAAQDERIKIIDLAENKGAAAARNEGIDKAQGEYLGFVDSDDFVDLDFYEKLYNKATEEEADCAKGNYRNAQTGDVDYSLNEMIRENKNNFAFAYCSAIFKKQVVRENNIYFPLLSDMEDPVFAFAFALKANKVEIVDDACINIVARENSLTRRILSEKQIKDKFIGLNKIIDLANHSKIEESVYSKVIGFWVWQTFSNSIKTDDAILKKEVVEDIFMSLENIKNCGLLFKYMSEYAELLTLYLQNKQIDELQNYSGSAEYKHQLLRRLRKNIKGDDNA